MKRLKLFVIVMLTMAVIMSCAGTPEADNTAVTTAPEPAPPPPPAATSNVPAWLSEIPPEDVIWGIGFIKLQNSNLAMQRATQLAQQDVANQISVLVQGSLTGYANESGDLNNSRSIQSIESITRTLTNMNLSGAVPDKRDLADDGTWWVRVMYRKADAQRTINQVVNNEMADYAEFKADQALKRLEYDLEKSQSRPTPRTE